jgi:hypothetical protein
VKTFFVGATFSGRRLQRSADFQSAVSPNCIRPRGVCADAFGLPAVSGFQIRDTAEFNSALLRLRLPAPWILWFNYKTRFTARFQPS